MTFFNFPEKKRFVVVQSVLVICFIPVYFILEANNQYWKLISSGVSIKLYLIVFSSMLFSFLFLQFLIERQRAMLIVSWLAFHYLYFLKIFIAVKSISFLSIFKEYKFYLPLISVVVLFFMYLILRMKLTGVKKLSGYLTALLAILILFELYRSARHMIADKNQDVKFLDTVVFKKNTASARPDIFLIVMDEYAGFRPLKQVYGYENNDFLKKLEQLGFFVAREPMSNYNGTLFSTLSLLNMNYIDTSFIGDVRSHRAYAKTAKAIEYSVLFDIFRQLDYSIVNNSFLRINKINSDPFYILPIEDRLILDKTLGSVIKDDLLLNIPSNKIQFLLKTFYAKNDIYNQNRIKYFEQLGADSKDPMFVYTHLIMPHSPYLRDANGNLRSLSDAHSELKKKKYDTSYLNYLKYCNRVVLNMVNSIQSKQKNAIIILVSDHGNRFYNKSQQEDFEFSNFISVYSADKKYVGFSDTVSLVNVFRLILNNQFGQNFKILENQQVNMLKGVLN